MIRMQAQRSLANIRWNLVLGTCQVKKMTGSNSSMSCTCEQVKFVECCSRFDVIATLPFVQQQRLSASEFKHDAPCLAFTRFSRLKFS